MSKWVLRTGREMPCGRENIFPGECGGVFWPADPTVYGHGSILDPGQFSLRERQEIAREQIDRWKCWAKTGEPT